MQITKSEIIALAAAPKQYPKEGVPEIAFAGRSNVGKSSLLNFLTNRKKLAYVSGAPGKTRTINFYAINGDAFRIVDLPGYGYAKLSRSITKEWGKMLESYLESRESLKRVALLVDIRHEPSAQDKELYDYLKHYGLSGLIVCTKADKISVGARGRQVDIIRKALGADAADAVVCVSALKRTGAEELLAEIEGIL